MLSNALLSESASKRGLRELIALDIDAFNVMCVLRAREWGMSPVDAEQLIIEPQFKIPRDTLVALARSVSPAQVMSLVSRTPYQEALGQHEASPALGWIEQLDSGFEKLKFRAARRTFTWDIFGTSKALGILKLLEYEIRALSGIAFGIGQRMPAEGIIKDLSWFAAE
jgi:V/A-type H+/Na+-transporting ATPase subunit C